MKITAIAAVMLVSAVFSVTGNHHAYAQAQTGQTKNQTKAPVMVTVAEGDNLSGIASTHNTTYVRIFDANDKISDPNLIYPGDSLRIPDPSEQLPDRQLPASATPTYTAPAPTPVRPAPISQPAVSQPAVVQSAPVSGCGDNAYANFIYSHESGCRTTAVNPGGCYGIGQACPGSKIAYCGADYACQNAFFTAYAAKYGGWAGAYAFWVAHHWW